MAIETEEIDIIEIISRCSGIRKSELNIDSCASEFSKWDSLAHVKIILEIEKKYEKKINTSKMSSLDSVKKIKLFINK